MYIYVLELSCNKYYVGSSNYPVNLSYSEYLCDNHIWLKNFKIVGYVEIVPDCSDYDVEKYVIKYMQKFGIDNVRGGTFYQNILPKHTLKTLHAIIFKGINSPPTICEEEFNISRPNSPCCNNLYICDDMRHNYKCRRPNYIN